MLAAWQISYGSLLMGAGTAYGILSLTGLDDMPEVRTGDVPKQNDNGVWRGVDRLGGRTIELSLLITGVDDTSFRAAVAALRDATEITNTESALTWHLPGDATDFAVTCRPRRRAMPITFDGSLTQRCTLQFYASDPTISAA